MDRASLIDEVINYLQQKRYVVVFDDVWGLHFWNDIEFAVIDNKNGSKILITTRNQDVIDSCKRSSFTEVLQLESLTQEQSLELFNKKAFRFYYGGCCPKELNHIAYEIVKKCKGLPLAIVAIGGLLSTRDKNVFEWKRFSENLSLELKKDKHLFGIRDILGLSFNDLPYYLKSCLLYFGIYPKAYEVNLKRVTRQWIAEGFVKEERGKTLEEVAEEYLKELIHRSLVQVSSLRIDGKAKCCRIHDLIHNMILEKIEDLNFCKHISEDGQSSSSGNTRRLSIITTSDDSLECIESSHIRSLFFLTENKINDSLVYFAKRIPRKYRLLKVLDYQFVPLGKVPDKLGILNHLKFLSLRHTFVSEVPKSIGMLQNLETLDVRNTSVFVLPKEISKLRKLRHLLGELSLIKLKDGLGEMTSLETLDRVLSIPKEVIKELGRLKQIRVLVLYVHAKYGSILTSSLNEMQHLEKLYIQSPKYPQVIDLHLISSPTMLQKLTLIVRLQNLPVLIPELQNLVVLRLTNSRLTKDPLESLKGLQHLLILHLRCEAYEGLDLHAEAGGFQKLKELYVRDLYALQDIIIDKGALPSLKKLSLFELFRLNHIPTGIKHLEKLEALYISYVQFLEHNSTEDWIMEHVPFFRIVTKNGKIIENSRS
ncbi:disease resistance protein rpm1-like [Trifolium pratense]|uniref:Disease resistance protein rpm1-like n=1 Tax=Trifolium pratense TaxID=57577 RepID=A0A2K3NCS9_TRIPR|nr:disease resistance protein rpm1-like [Trifolium pratense]